jgi:hypothetical protein
MCPAGGRPSAAQIANDDEGGQKMCRNLSEIH